MGETTSYAKINQRLFPILFGVATSLLGAACQVSHPQLFGASDAAASDAAVDAATDSTVTDSGRLDATIDVPVIDVGADTALDVGPVDAMPDAPLDAELDTSMSECSRPEDCGAALGSCQSWACEAGACVRMPAPDEMECALMPSRRCVAGRCQSGECAVDEADFFCSPTPREAPAVDGSWSMCPAGSAMIGISVRRSDDTVFRAVALCKQVTREGFALAQGPEERTTGEVLGASWRVETTVDAGGCGSGFMRGMLSTRNGRAMGALGVICEEYAIVSDVPEPRAQADEMPRSGFTHGVDDDPDIREQCGPQEVVVGFRVTPVSEYDGLSPTVQIVCAEILFLDD